jgi:nucleoside-diphosphate-sugar epimerase
MRVFLTGATGYIGAFVARELKRHGHDVVGLARNAVAAEKLRRAGIHAAPGDLEDHAALRDRVLDADAVVHCAAAMGPRMADVDAGALAAMLEALGGRHQAFVYTSGIWVYGSRGDAVVGEDAPLAPTPLVAWRPAHERSVLGAGGSGLRTIVIRPAIVYGESGGMVGGMIEQARTGTLRIVGEGTNRWSCVRVDALAELYVRALERAVRGAIYNATRGAAVPYVEIARAAARAAGGDGSVEHLPLEDARGTLGPFADALALDLQVSSERAARELGWEPHRPTILEDLSATTVV